MNPFSSFLGQWSSNKGFEEFVSYWDGLESIVVRVYRRKTTPDEVAADFERIWPWLRNAYPEWQQQLLPYWQATKAAGEPTETDPFALLLGFSSPNDILGDWRAMQHLPAAREAINRLLQDEGTAAK